MRLNAEMKSGVVSVEDTLAAARQLRRSNKPVEASRLLLETLRNAPELGSVHAELGLTLFGLGLVERGVEALERAVRFAPNVVRYRVNLSGMYHHLGRFKECIALGLPLVEEDPTCGLAHINLGLSYSGLGDWAKSIEHFEQATIALPGHSGAWLNLGLGYENRCADVQANQCFKNAVRIAPENLKSWICLATSNLRLGAFSEGWEQFSKRFELDPSLAPQGDTPIWKGESLEGRSIHLIAEQGLGDLVQFIRFAKPLSEQGAQVFATVPKMLRDILATVPGITECFSGLDVAPPCDYQSTVMELPRWLGINASNIPLTGGYLRPKPAPESMTQRLASLGSKKKVGIVWSGNPNHINDGRRSMSFDDLACLLDVPNIRLVNLQLGSRVEQLREHPRANEVSNWMTDGMSASDTASLISCLDLVITVDTFVAHLSGALNVPTWLCVARNPDWRWLTKRSDSPWYESVRIFRQDDKESWSTVGEAMVEALRAEPS